jgi:hypothetical protein
MFEAPHAKTISTEEVNVIADAVSPPGGYHAGRLRVLGWHRTPSIPKPAIIHDLAESHTSIQTQTLEGRLAN